MKSSSRPARPADRSRSCTSTSRRTSSPAVRGFIVIFSMSRRSCRRPPPTPGIFRSGQAVELLPAHEMVMDAVLLAAAGRAWVYETENLSLGNCSSTPAEMADLPAPTVPRR